MGPVGPVCPVGPLIFISFWSCQAASHPVWIYGNGECRILDTLTGDLELE